MLDTLTLIKTLINIYHHYQAQITTEANDPTDAGSVLLSDEVVLLLRTSEVPLNFF